MRIGVHLGRLSLFLWSGGWCWFDRMDCEGHCRNWYFGPFGIEWRPRTEPYDWVEDGSLTRDEFLERFNALQPTITTGPRTWGSGVTINAEWGKTP